MKKKLWLAVILAALATLANISLATAAADGLPEIITGRDGVPEYD